jgi:hypothetical protein
MIAGCTLAPKRNPVPADLTAKVGIPGIPEARFWGHEWPTYSAERLRAYSEEEFRTHLAGVYQRPHNYLAISGGGAKGAFGAGLLKGMSRPAPVPNTPW